MNLDQLNLSKKTLNVLNQIGMRTIDDLTKWEVRLEGKSEPMKPSQAIARLIQEAGGGRGLPMGIDAFKELFDAMTLQLAKTMDRPPVDQQATQLVAAMLSGGTGDFGGYDHAALMAEIAFDYIDAIRREQRKREA